MIKSFFAAAFLVFMSLSSFAQIDYAQPPQMYCPAVGRWLPQGICPQVVNGQQVIGGQQVIVQQPQCPGQLVQTQFGLQCRIPQGSQYANQALQQGLNGFSKCQLVGAGVGALLGSFAKNHTNQAIIGGALLGGIAGDVVCTPTVQHVQPQQVQQAVYHQQQMQTHAAGGAVCVLPNRDRGDLTPEECRHLGGIFKGHGVAGRVPAQVQASSRSGQVCTAENGNPAGSVLAKVTKVGHPRYGDTVCAMPNDENVQVL